MPRLKRGQQAGDVGDIEDTHTPTGDNTVQFTPGESTESTAGDTQSTNREQSPTGEIIGPVVASGASTDGEHTGLQLAQGGTSEVVVELSQNQHTDNLSPQQGVVVATVGQIGATECTSDGQVESTKEVCDSGTPASG